MDKPKPVELVVVGMGVRSRIYAQEAFRHPEKLRIVGVADVNPEALALTRKTFGIPRERCFPSAEALAAAPRFAQGAINGTMDPQHVETTLPLLRRGYDVLLEKPFALNQRQADLLLSCARETGRQVMVCHVLRYAPFYRTLKELLTSGEIGRIQNLHMTEQVSYFHHSVSYIRGKYASPELCGSGMLLSKCCHDLDLLAWLMADSLPCQVSSLGALFQFRPDRAPAQAGTHCLLDCPMERDCPYSAGRLYLEAPQRWAENIWHDSGREVPSNAEKLRLLSDRENPYSRCVYRCGLSIVDHQSVLIGFQNGATATFSMNGGAPSSSRTLHLIGTKAEAWGRFEENRLTLSRISPGAAGGREEECIPLPSPAQGDAHGGGDQALVMDFVSLLQGQAPSLCCTSLEDSMVGHRLVFRAEDSRLQGGAMLSY